MKDWKEFMEEMTDRVKEGLDYFCWNISGDTPLDCYSAHQDIDLYDLALEFEGSSSGITEKDIERLKQVPEKIYKEYGVQLEKDIEEVVDKLRKEEGD